jgi:hypothetical protein
MLRKLVLPLVLVVVFGAGGCKPQNYNVVIKNVGAGRVDRAQVRYGSFRSIGGVLSPGIWKIHGNPDYPIPDVATVEWRTEDGEMHSRQVEVKKLVPKGFKGDIQFEIADDHTVTVRVIPRDDM